MTEYGRGHGSEPWHPEDPLYGDQGWGGRQAAASQSPYGGQHQHYPQQPQQVHYDDQHSYGGQGYGGQQEYDAQGYGQQDYGGQQHQSGGYPQYDHTGGWDTGQGPAYGTNPDPYADQQSGYSGEQQPDYYGTPEAYPPPRPPDRRREEPPQNPDWDPGPDQGEHAFFAGGGDDDAYDDDYDDSRESRRGRGDRRGKGRKRRSGLACLVVAVVLLGGLGGVIYFGTQFYQDRFGPTEDYAGDGTGDEVIVEIPKGAGGNQIGNILKQAGVVKSVDAFVSAQGKNSKGLSIQAGVYTLKKEMSAKSAVELMLDDKSRNNLIIAEGRRNVWVYEQIDKRLEQPEGTTAKYAKENWKDLGLPDWANSGSDIKDPLEGFLYPSSYPVAKGMDIGDVLKKMVATADQEYEKFGLKAKADGLNLKDPLQVLTVASLVQAEGKYKHDFEKVATVVYNRLKPDNTETYGLLDFDSTVNYLKGESKLGTGSVSDLRKIDDPYNTYKIKGLPPGPIGNPGKEAIDASLSPAKGDWYYFVSINEDETLFAETNAEHERNRKRYLEELEKSE
ncbi:endolytic transglycosylase MltG [Streptomyces sp. E11-3]|uniref:endolytic transglycosylase MltG n=1 Tax=Streptomyces sp. E11-3 TaxID=3110112 RepID=UPI0039812B66